MIPLVNADWLQFSAKGSFVWLGQRGFRLVGYLIVCEDTVQLLATVVVVVLA